MASIQERARRQVNLGEFASTGTPDKLATISVAPPSQRQYILRMPVRVEGGGYYLPCEMEWVRPLFSAARKHQWGMDSDHPFCYITVRHGIVSSQTDDEWHTDGFSTRVPHVPEHNYVWCSEVGTEYVPLNVTFPSDFNPLLHNVNRYLQRFLDHKRVVSCEAQTLYCFDPYILHRRPPATSGMQRTFVRISFVPIEINDVNNTQNPALPRVYDRDGVSYRDSLVEYGN